MYSSKVSLDHLIFEILINLQSIIINSMFYQLMPQNMYFSYPNVFNQTFRPTLTQICQFSSCPQYFFYSKEYASTNCFYNQAIPQMEKSLQFNQDTKDLTNNSNFNQSQENQVQIENNGIEAQKVSLEQYCTNKQKFGRNILSNIFHLMVKYAIMEKKLRKKIERIIYMHNMTIKPHQYYRIMKKMKTKLTAYTTNSQIKQFFQGVLWETQNSNSKNQECCKIFRILSTIYLENNHLPYVYNSNKIKKQSKKIHIAAVRKLYEVMR